VELHPVRFPEAHITNEKINDDPDQGDWREQEQGRDWFHMVPSLRKVS
jgi:hypothetical protein